jgi:outer membrane lipoprotein-sorting protein
MKHSIRYCSFKPSILSHFYKAFYKIYLMKKITLLMLLASLLSASLPIPNQIHATFHQTVIHAENNETLNYQGRMWIQLPNEAKWIYEKPIEKIICLLRNRAWVIEPELEQATLFQLHKAIPLLELLKKAQQIAPHTYKATYEDMEYTITTDKNEQVKKVEYIDDLGNRVILAFEDVETKPFDQSLLKCTIPEDYDIIDGRF